jgi:hypothetical protein
LRFFAFQIDDRLPAAPVNKRSPLLLAFAHYHSQIRDNGDYMRMASALFDEGQCSDSGVSWPFISFIAP